MKQKSRALVALLSLGCLASIAGAQNEPPAAAPDEPAVAERKGPVLEVGWGDWNLRGSDTFFRRYGGPARGFFIKDFSHLLTNDAASYRASWDVRGLPQDDHWMNGTVVLNYGRTVLQGWSTKSEFTDSSPFTMPVSEQKAVEVLAKQRLTHDAAVTLRYSMEQKDRYLEAPRPERHQRTRYLDLNAQGAVAGGQGGVGYTDFRYWDRTDKRPDTQVQRWTAHYDRNLTPTIDAGGSYAHSRITQTGSPNSTVESYALGAGWQMSDRTDLSFAFKHDKIEVPVVRNSYVRERITAGGRLVHRLGAWTANVGYTHREAERVRADRSFVDVPIWDKTDVRLTGKLGEGLRMTIRGTYEHLRGRPVMVMADTRSTYWDDNRTFQAKVDKTADRFGAYGSVTYRAQRNTLRDVNIKTTAFNLGGTFDASSSLSFFGEVSSEKTDATGEGVQNRNFDAFFPSSRVVALGASYGFKPEFSLTATYTQIGTDNVNPMFERGGNYKGRFLTLGLVHRTKQGNEFGVLFAPWHYEDKTDASVNYAASVIALTGKVKF
ncbi:MAG: hypothetical protein KIS66_03365 [Fimbriimonadaceae bacterium]|nr:hypothetical protein [Fimbriimonadaceae bacterium]